MSIQDTSRLTDDTDGLLRSDCTDAEALAARLKEDDRIQRKCRRAALAGAGGALCLLGVHIYAQVVGAPSIPGGINSILVGLCLFAASAWLIEWITRSSRRHMLGLGGGRDYGQGVMDGISLKLDAGGPSGR